MEKEESRTPTFKIQVRTLNASMPEHEALPSSRKSYCTTPGVGSVSKKFKVKVFYMMGKALSGELSCPCDRSCLFNCQIRK